MEDEGQQKGDPSSKSADSARKSAPRRLLLNEALALGTDEMWSEARRNAYKLLQENENAYFFRFNLPGEQQKVGKWSEEEKELFFKHFKEMYGDLNLDDEFSANKVQWGIFSKAIPGRVGYQCAYFYRSLFLKKNKQRPAAAAAPAPKKKPSAQPRAKENAAPQQRKKSTPTRSSSRRPSAPGPSDALLNDLLTGPDGTQYQEYRTRLKKSCWIREPGFSPDPRTLISTKGLRCLATTGGVVPLTAFLGKGRRYKGRRELKKPTRREWLQLARKRFNGSIDTAFAFQQRWIQSLASQQQNQAKGVKRKREAKGETKAAEAKNGERPQADSAAPEKRKRGRKRMKDDVDPDKRRATLENCHHCKSKKDYWILCPISSRHRFCNRCVINHFGLHYNDIFPDGAGRWDEGCPACLLTCPCAACRNRKASGWKRKRAVKGEEGGLAVTGKRGEEIRGVGLGGGDEGEGASTASSAEESEPPKKRARRTTQRAREAEKEKAEEEKEEEEGRRPAAAAQQRQARGTKRGRKKKAKGPDKDEADGDVEDEPSPVKGRRKSLKKKAPPAATTGPDDAQRCRQREDASGDESEGWEVDCITARRFRDGKWEYHVTWSDLWLTKDQIPADCVRTIADRRERKGDNGATTMEYLVKWKPSWEPEENLCPDALHSWRQRHSKPGEAEEEGGGGGGGEGATMESDAVREQAEPRDAEEQRGEADVRKKKPAIRTTRRSAGGASPSGGGGGAYDDEEVKEMKPGKKKQQKPAPTRRKAAPKHALINCDISASNILRRKRPRTMSWRVRPRT